MVLGLMALTLVAGYLLWTLRVHLEEIDTAAEERISYPRRAGLFFLTLAGLTIVGILAILLVNSGQLIAPGTL
jgi:hypothetical protein